MLEAGGLEDRPINVLASSRLAFQTELELSEVTYAYHRGGGRADFVLGPVDLTLRPEELVFLVGGNGSGKTTLVKLIAGLYTPEAGAIRLDGRPVTAELQEEYRQLFSIIFADNYLFQELLGLDRDRLDARARHARSVERGRVACDEVRHTRTGAVEIVARE